MNVKGREKGSILKIVVLKREVQSCESTCRQIFFLNNRYNQLGSVLSSFPIRAQIQR